MKLAKYYVLLQHHEDERGRTNRKYFQTDGPHGFKLVDHLKDATHFRTEKTARQMLDYYTDFPAFTVCHVPLPYYPFDVTIGPLPRRSVYRLSERSRVAFSYGKAFR